MKKTYTKEDLIRIETEYDSLIGAIERVILRCMALKFGQIIGVPETWNNLGIDKYEISGDTLSTEASLYHWGETEISSISFPVMWLSVKDPDDLIKDHCQKIVDEVVRQKANLEERTKNRVLELERAQFELLKAKFEPVEKE